MQILIIISCCLTLCYTVLMLLYRKGWYMQKTFKVREGYQPHTKASIIIPARNEAKNISACISSILAQDYPKELYEVIVIDDHSTDDTANIVAAFKDDKVQCIRLSEYVDRHEVIKSYKKKALSIGIQHSSGELIITTDADCNMPTEWLKYMAAIYEQEKPVMVVAPVDFTCNSSVLQLFQSIDFMSMQGITVAARQMKMGNMSNGANLAFSRSAFAQVKGYEGVYHLASGDDYLLMMKMQRVFPDSISYLKAEQAIVKTLPQMSWHDFFQQRIRWASKSGKYEDRKLTVILSLVYLFNVSFLVLVVAGIFMPVLFKLCLAMLAWKIVIELFYLYPVAKFYKKQKQLRYFPLLQPLHILYIIIAGWLGFFGSYQWKGRKSS